MDVEMNADIKAQAMVWVIQLREGDDLDWDAFETWLASDPAHVVAFHNAEDMDAALDTVLPQLDFRGPANDTADHLPLPHSRPVWRWAAAIGAIAACGVGAVTVLPSLLSARYEVVTSRGENQIVTLNEGTRIILNGATRVVFDRNDPRFAELKEGEALFHVSHDERAPFRLYVGDDEVEDAGTVFNVVRDGAVLRVAVAEGSVIYNPGRERVSLSAGQQMVASDNAVKVGDTDTQSVGAWQKGQLVYKGETLARVAADLSRALDRRIKPSPEIANRPFFGTLFLEGTPDEQVRHVETALGVHLEVRGQEMTMVPMRERRD